MSRGPWRDVGIHVLYRMFDSGGALLYVGITNNPKARIRNHQDDKTWFSLVSNITVEHFDSREELAVAETSAIKSEQPRYNIALRTLFTAKECWEDGHGAPKGKRCDDCDGLYLQDQINRDYDELDRQLVEEMAGDESEAARVTRSYLGLAGGDMTAEEIRETATWKAYSAMWVELMEEVDKVSKSRDGAA